MNKRIILVPAGIIFTLTLILGLLPACTGGSITPSPSSSPSTSPVPSGVKTWRYQSNAQAGSSSYWLEQEFVSSIERASDGRIKIDLQPLGGIVGAMEIFDAVATGAIEVGSAPDSYWQGKDQRFNLAGIITTSLTWQQAAVYYEARDYRGLSMLGDGYNPIVLVEPEFGISGLLGIEYPPYKSLQIGVIDFISRGDVSYAYDQKFQEVTQYWIFPGMQQCRVSSFLINLKLWNALPPDLQEIITLACSHNLLRSWSFTHVENAKLIPVLQQQYGIKMVRLSPECQTTWKTVTWRIADSFAARLTEFKTMWENQKSFMNMLAPYEDLQRVTYAASN